jgi:hypothetical protein
VTDLSFSFLTTPRSGKPHAQRLHERVIEDFNMIIEAMCNDDVAGDEADAIADDLEGLRDRYKNLCKKRAAPSRLEDNETSAKRVAVDEED